MEKSWCLVLLNRYLYLYIKKKRLYCYTYGIDAETIEWENIVQRVMQIDNSWNKTAGKYIDVYNSIRVRW